MNAYFLPHGMLTLSFLRALVFGAAVGACFDCFTAIRITARAGKGLTAVLDGIFLLLALPASFRFFVLYAYGLPRVLAAAGIFLGWWGERRTTGPLLLFCAGAACRAIRTFVRTAGKFAGKVEYLGMVFAGFAAEHRATVKKPKIK